MSCFAKFGEINAISSMSVLPFALSICVCSSEFYVNKVKLILNILEHRTRGVFLGATERF